ncbi:MAG: aminopeptidase P family protein [Bacteroidales bacterium]|nr:aminopeptidase P family protein [Bacteroidales bacterium]
MNSPVKKLDLLRAALIQNKIDVYIIPTADPHLGENMPDHWKIIPWLTGFTGSAATVVITDTFAGLWTDSRYFIQAEKQLAGSGFELTRPKAFQSLDYLDWLSENINQGSRIALDGRIFSISQIRKLEKAFERKKMNFDLDCDLISELWTDRPPMPYSVAFDYPVEFCGKDRSRKIAEVREQMKKQHIDIHFLTSVDDIMWLLNIRGNDLAYSPLLISFLLISEKQVLFFVENKKIPIRLAQEFNMMGMVLMPYEEAAGIISDLSEGSSILINPATTSVSLYNSIPERLRIIEDISIPTRLKAIKNKTEIENIGKVMVKDGIALTKFFFWFEHSLGKIVLTELSLADKILEFRSAQKDFLGPSFSTITAFNEHAALPHYSPASETDSEIEECGILLVDSGGQYLGGTTDITRTISIGAPGVRQKKDFTLVLKGHISLASAKFPLGTKGYQLDLLARKALWEHGLNYGHGTGHGVGCCLNVHEGPHNISPADNKTIIESGMLISNEPAIYREGEYGIRTENLIICYEDEETEFGQFLKFETVSLCYIDKTMIDKSLLDQKEINWLNDYHSEVYDKISPHLTEAEKEWLKEKTDPLN